MASGRRRQIAVTIYDRVRKGKVRREAKKDAAPTATH